MPRWSGKFRIPIASFIRPSLQSQIISALILCEDDVSWRAVMALAVMVEVLALIISMISSEKHSMVLRWAEAIHHVNHLHGFARFWLPKKASLQSPGIVAKASMAS